MKVPSALATVAIHLGIALATAAADWWAPPLFAGHSLVLGQVVYWLAVRRLGLLPGLTSLFCSVMVLWLKWGQPYSALLIALESVIVGAAWRRARSPFVADLLFWAVVGTPLTWLLYRHVLVFPDPIFSQAMLVQVANGFIAAWAAIALDRLLPNRAAAPSAEPYARFLWKRYLTVGIFPLVAASVVAGLVYEKSAVREAKARLCAVAAAVADGVERRLDKTLTALYVVAAHEPETTFAGGGEEARRALASVLAQDPALVSARYVDAQERERLAMNVPKAAWERRPLYGSMKVAGKPVPILSKLGLSTDGKRSKLLSLSIPMLGPHGESGGRLEVVLSLSALEQGITGLPKEPDWRAAIVRRDLRMVGGLGSPEDFYSNLSGSPYGTLVGGAQHVSRKYTDTTGGYPAIYFACVEPIPSVGWYVVVQRSWSGMLQPITAFFLGTLCLALCVGLAVAGGAAWSVRGVIVANRALNEFARRPGEYAKDLAATARETPDIPLETRLLMQDLADMAVELEAEKAQGRRFTTELETIVNERTSQLKEALVAATAADRAKTLFVATVSHELRTPLTAIISGVAILRQAAEAPTPVHARALTSLDKSSRLLYKIVSDILDFSKLETGALAPARAPFQPAAVVAGMVEKFEAQARAAGLELRLVIDLPYQFECVGDAGRITQILANLVGNALKFTGEGWVEIAVSLREAEVRRFMRFVVQDTGPGIPEAAALEIFQPFVQLQATSGPRRGGTGLGLAISMRFARILGGSLKLIGEPEQGAIFELLVPLEVAGELDAPPSPADGHSRPA